VQAAEPAKETADLSFAAAIAAHQPHASGHGIVVDAQKRVGVPSFLGEPLRVAVESAGTAGLALQVVGSGIAREQVPAPGSMVPPGTEIVVRFTR
jgi:cell division protein FtsI (penicillin-binding protein 3)